jgi:hypothetical protein
MSQVDVADPLRRHGGGAILGYVRTCSGRRWAALATLVAAVLGAGSVAPPAAATDRVIATDPGENIDAFNGTFAWSEANRLTLFSGGVRRFAPVRSFGSSSVNAKLGPGRDGSTVATYSRCKGALGGCDLFVLGLRSGHERRLRSLSTRRSSEYTVAGWQGRYLFARSGRRGGVFVSGPLRRISRRASPWTDLDLRGRVAVFSDATPDRSGEADPFDMSVRVVRLSRRGVGRQCVVARHGVFVVSPLITRRFVYWVDRPESGSVVLRRRIPSRRCIQRGRVERLRPRPGRLEEALDVAVTRGRVFYPRSVNSPTRPPTFTDHFLVEMTDPLVRDP